MRRTSGRGNGEWRRIAAAPSRAIALRPDLAVAHINKGAALSRLGRRDEAIGAYHDAIVLVPAHAQAHSNLGVALHEAGRLEEASAALERAIALAPELAEAHGNLGNVVKDLGRTEDAIAAYRRAVTLKPEDAVAHANLGVALYDAGRPDEAIAAYHRAIALRPDDFESHTNLGVALHATGQTDLALAACRRAIAIEGDDAAAYCNLAVALRGAGRRDEAIAALERAIALDPGLVAAHTNLGDALHESGQLDLAVATLERALALRPDDADAGNNLGHVFRDQGRLDLALDSFRRAVAVKPGFAKVASNLLFALHSHPDYDAQAILAEHRQWALRYADPLAPLIGPHPNDRTPGRRLRVGYVSPDFRAHAVGQLLLPLFANHDRRQVEIVCYSDVRVSDALTARLQPLADLWHSTVGLGDAQVAELIRADRIDILVDLALHTAGNRMLVFARKPAPVQVSMLAMPATSGLTTIDYRLTDPYLDPPGAHDADYTEQSIRLPHCFWIFQPPEELIDVGTLPASRNGFVTFGSLNQLAKVTRPALELWVKILQALPGARLVLQSPPGSHLDGVRALFEQGGIAADRLEFVPRAPRLEYLRRFQNLDLGLDPFPYNGHTSMLDALWMGVPVVTLAGRTCVGRGGVSILSNLGLPELIARTPEQYVDIAVGLAKYMDRLSSMRGGLRQKMAASPLCDGKQYAASVEAAFRQMWQTWCGTISTRAMDNVK